MAWYGATYTTTGTGVSLTSILTAGDAKFAASGSKHAKQVRITCNPVGAAPIYVGRSSVTAAGTGAYGYAQATAAFVTVFEIGPFDTNAIPLDDVYVVGGGDDAHIAVVT